VDFSIGADGQISAAIICGETSFAVSIAEFRESWKEGRIDCAWHADLEEIRENQRLRSGSDIYFRTACKGSLAIIPVTDEQVKEN
jgi:hypothetical protein